MEEDPSHESSIGCLSSASPALIKLGRIESKSRHVMRSLVPSQWTPSWACVTQDHKESSREVSRKDPPSPGRSGAPAPKDRGKAYPLCPLCSFFTHLLAGEECPCLRLSPETIAIISQLHPAFLWGLGVRQKPRGAAFMSAYTHGKRKLHPLSICYVLSIPTRTSSHSFGKAEATSVTFASFLSA